MTIATNSPPPPHTHINSPPPLPPRTKGSVDRPIDRRNRRWCCRASVTICYWIGLLTVRKQSSKFRESNVFTGVCLSWGVCASHALRTYPTPHFPPLLGYPAPCFRHLVVISGDLFKLVHLRPYSPNWYWRLVVATVAGFLLYCTRPTGMLSCYRQPWPSHTSVTIWRNTRRNRTRFTRSYSASCQATHPSHTARYTRTSNTCAHASRKSTGTLQ